MLEQELSRIPPAEAIFKLFPMQCRFILDLDIHRTQRNSPNRFGLAYMWPTRGRVGRQSLRTSNNNIYKDTADKTERTRSQQLTDLRGLG